MDTLEFTSLIIEGILFLLLIAARFFSKKPSRYKAYMTISLCILITEFISTDYGVLLDDLVIIQYYNTVLSTALSMLIFFFYFGLIALIIYSYKEYKR